MAVFEFDPTDGSNRLETSTRLSDHPIFDCQSTGFATQSAGTILRHVAVLTARTVHQNNKPRRCNKPVQVFLVQRLVT